MTELILFVFLLITFKASGVWWGIFVLALIVDLLLSILGEQRS